jgi:hypothetical protein
LANGIGLFNDLGLVWQTVLAFSMVCGRFGKGHWNCQWFAVVLEKGIGLFNGFGLVWKTAFAFSMICGRFGEWHWPCQRLTIFKLGLANGTRCFHGLRSFW